MKTTFTILISLLLAGASFGQLPKKATKKMGQNPVLFLDSAEIDFASLQTLDPFDISSISIVKPRKAKRILGDKGIDGAVYVTTVKEAKKTYWNFFCTKSEDYRQLLNSPQADTIVQYVLNGQALADSAAPGSLFLITNQNFESITIVDKEKLPGDPVTSKRYVVAITAKRPKGLLETSATK